LVKVLLYLIRWQLSTPILYICINKIPISNEITKVIIANLIGGLIFYPIDNIIMKLKTKKEEGK